MKRMPSGEVWTFPREQARTAQCATVKADGHPHVVPGELIVWVTSPRIIAKKDMAGW